MKNKVCYLGDDSIDGAAAYLSGVMNYFGIAYDRVNSDQEPDAAFDETVYRLYIISDYPRKNFGDSGRLERIVRNVREFGSGLLMIGGWESFHGRLGEYHNSPLREILPVTMASSDDRRNYPLSLVLHPTQKHPILDDLPWQTPPGVGGFNSITPKPEAETILEGVRFDLAVYRDEESASPAAKDRGDMKRVFLPLSHGDYVSIAPVEEVPMLVVAQEGNGRTAAFASDVAPHWTGGFVDWGQERLTQTVGDGFIEVGKAYARFWRNLIVWTAQAEQ